MNPPESYTLDLEAKLLSCCRSWNQITKTEISFWLKMFCRIKKASTVANLNPKIGQASLSR